MRITHTFDSHNDTHIEKHTQSQTHTLILLMTDECDNCWLFGEIPRKICDLRGIIQRGVVGLVHLWVP